MAIDNRKILIAIIIITLVLFPVVAFTTGPLRIVLGTLFVIFIPGYTLISALFPKKEDMGGIERVALSFGSSIAIVPLIGLILNYTPWGISLYPILISISIFIVVTSAISDYRQHKLSENERLSFLCKLNLPDMAAMNKFDKFLYVLLIVVVIASLVSIGYVVAKPKQDENFTEFYILGPEGKAENYPYEILLGDSADIIVTIINYEHKPASYLVEITIDGSENTGIDFGTLVHEEKREKEVGFTSPVLGNNQKVAFYLYQNDADDPYFDSPLHLYVDVVTFSILDSGGTPVNYIPYNKQGESIELSLKIVNTEHQPTNYRVEIKTGDTLYKQILTRELAYNEKWEDKVGFIPSVEEKQTVECWLFKGNETMPYYEQPISFTIESITP